MTRRGRGILLAGLLLGSWGLAAGSATIAALGLAASTVVVVALATTRRPEHLQATIAVPRDRVGVGEVVAADVVVTNRGRRRSRPCGALVEVADRPHPITIPPLAPGGSIRFAVPLPTLRRGLKRVGPVGLTHADALGLVPATGVLGEQVDFRVHPRISDARLRLVSPSSGDGAESARSHLTSDLAVTRLREYQPGDDRRFVHWPTSARLGRMVVREDISPTPSTTVIVLDARTDGWEEAAFEQGVSLVGTLAVSCHRGATEAHVVVGRRHCPVNPGDHLAPIRALDLLAEVERDPSEPHWWDTTVAAGVTVVVVAGRIASPDWEHGRRLAGTRSQVVLVEVRSDARHAVTRTGGVICHSGGSADEVLEQWAMR